MWDDDWDQNDDLFQHQELQKKAIAAVNDQAVRFQGSRPMTRSNGQRRGHGKEGQTLHVVFVGNLPQSVCEIELQDHFAKFGKIHSVFISRKAQCDPTFGFVRFWDAADAEEAVNALNQTEFNGNRLVVDLSRKPMDKDEVEAYKTKQSHNRQPRKTQNNPSPNDEENAYILQETYVKIVSETSQDSGLPDWNTLVEDISKETNSPVPVFTQREYDISIDLDTIEQFYIQRLMDEVVAEGGIPWDT